jgi:protein phosphatase
MRYTPGNAQHIGARREQQDAFAFSNPDDKNFLSHGGFLAIVSDGMGGLSHGHQASSAAVRAFLSSYESKAPAEAIPAAMKRSFQAAFAAVQGMNRSATDAAGATLVAAVAHADQLHWIAAGDSRIYLIRRGRVAQLNRDHAYREKLLDEVLVDRVSLTDAMSHPEREHLTSYLGMAGTPEVDCNVKPLDLEPGDYVVICTDGVYRAVSDGDFVRVFTGGSPGASCDALEQIVLSRATQGQDNLTVVAIRCEEEAAPAPAGSTGLRSKILAGAALLLLCVNIFAADRVWNSIHEKIYGPESNEPSPGKKGPGTSNDPGRSGGTAPPATQPGAGPGNTAPPGTSGANTPNPSSLPGGVIPQLGDPHGRDGQPQQPSGTVGSTPAAEASPKPNGATKNK